MTTFGGAANAGTQASTDTKNAVALGLKFHNVYTFECYGADGALKWREEVTNAVMDTGANDMLTNYFKGSAYTAAWYVGIATMTTNFATSDTLASHAGWTEFTAYTGPNRPAWTGGTASARSISNTASQAVFSINGAGGTVGGAFLVSNNTIGGTTGVLYGGATLTSARTLASGDTLNITVTLSLT
jgi:hypothetical protein